METKTDFREGIKKTDTGYICIECDTLLLSKRNARLHTCEKTKKRFSGKCDPGSPVGGFYLQVNTNCLHY